jgi:outer membrane protein OmpA-like peptidoglycan-associated protein
MRNFYNRVLFVIIFLAGPTGLSMAQEFLPALNDNYMGINQATLQPASIADSRFKVDVNLFGVNSDFYNDLIRFKSQGTAGFLRIYDADFLDSDHTLASPNGKDKNAIMNLSVLGPSFLINIDQKQAVGFIFRTRSIMNADDISEPLASSVVKKFELPDYWNKWYHDDNARLMSHIFSEYGLSYAREVFDLGAHYLKAGMTVKFLQGIGAVEMQSNDLYYYMYNENNNNEDADYLSLNSSHVNYGVSDNMNWGSDPNDKYPSGFDYKYISKFSVGLDLGVVYEFRPKYSQFRYDMDGKTGLPRNDKNKYFLKVGASVLDIGRMRYEKYYNSRNFLADFTDNYLDKVGDNSVPSNTHWMDINNTTLGFPPFVNLSDTLTQRQNQNMGVSWASDNESSFKMKLPTALSLQVDVNVIKGFYVNLTTFTALNQNLSESGNSHYMSAYSITPRYEHKWFSVMMPMTYNQYKQFDMGLGLRAAFLYIGVNNLFTVFYNDVYSITAYIGVKIPIWRDPPPADMDKDGVSDAKDLCPSAPGPWAMQGCPDRDGDGVPDHLDKCPDVAGLKEFDGCPDKDGDGIPDKDDLCPDVLGPKITNGCPDRDGDGVPDYLDECPDVAGPAKTNGCPDRDGDGVPDYKDKCPDQPGPPEQGGCPFVDTDGDGVKDSEDMCPDVPGPPENHGCPYTDTDGDGVPDIYDKCPLTPGPPENNGCPVIKVEEAAVLKTAFENTEFETGKSLIRSSSFASLDELAALLISKPTWKLRISGHTDNVGSPESNMTLSKNRAQAIAKYLQGKGVAKDQLIPEWFGDTRPIADNKTPEGRQKNRRVEMQIEFE